MTLPKRAIPPGGRPPGRSYLVPEAHQQGLSVNFDALEHEVFQYRMELTKFLESGNRSAAIRARKCLANIGRLAHMGRAGVQAARNDCIVYTE